MNSSAIRSDARLEAFYDVNNQLILDFPQTGADVGALNGKFLMSLKII